MGGDRGPEEVVRGVLNAAAGSSCGFLLVGDPAVIEPGPHQKRPDNVSVVPASDVIGMDESPTAALRRKPDASVAVGARLVREGRADALVTIGNTGAAMAVSLLTMGRIKGVDRPAIAAALPTAAGGSVLLLDAGATVDCDPNNLFEFAVMGSVYAEHVLGIRKPRVGLLSNGEEDAKGNELVKRTHLLFAQCAGPQAAFHFIGNVEGSDLFRGDVDVVVCDGFVGNVLLKTGEGVAEMILSLLRAELSRTVWTRALAGPLRPALRRLRSRLDYTERGGAPLLGVNGLCIIGHGRSNAAAVTSACDIAVRAAQTNVVALIRDRICHVPTPPPLS